MKSRLLLVLQDVEVNQCHNFSSLLLQSQPPCRLCTDLNETVEWIELLARAVWYFPVQEIDVFRKSRINAMIIHYPKRFWAKAIRQEVKNKTVACLRRAFAP